MKLFNPWLGLTVVAIALGIWETHRYWGYFLVRPGLLQEVNEFAIVESWGEIDTRSTQSTSEQSELIIQAKTNPSWGKTLEIAQAYCKSASSFFWDPSCLYNQTFLVFSQKQILTPETPRLASTTLSQWHRKLVETGLVYTPKSDWQAIDFRLGMVVVGRDNRDRPMAFVGLQGGQVENDRYPYYEVIFRKPGTGLGDWEAIAQRSFFIEIAGIEQMDPLIWIIETIKWWLFLSPTLLLYYGPKLWRKYRSNP